MPAEPGTAVAAAAPATGRAYATKLLALKLAAQQLSHQCALAHTRSELRRYLAVMSRHGGYTSTGSRLNPADTTGVTE
jgi:hypothetical protein